MAQLQELANEIRNLIVEVVLKNGGHLASNLGVVELTLALHRVFSTPEDSFVFDVSHQGYTHKILTGRLNKFSSLRQTEGLSGFLLREESPHDVYGGGHAGCALSAALGIAKARDLKCENSNVICLIGDGSLTCGVTMEAFNNIASTTKRLIVVLNDNEWSIDRNVGAMAKYLNELITNPLYNRLHDSLEAFLKKIPGGQRLMQIGGKIKSEAKDFLIPSSIFEKYGLRYVGPIDGHNLEQLVQYFSFCKCAQEPILLHVRTTKGKGFKSASIDPATYHGISGKECTKILGASEKNDHAKYQDVFGHALLEAAKKDNKVVAITAAMKSGTGLNKFATALPGQFFDVGIAEEHAVIFAAGLAVKGLKPVCAIYSTFLQRAFDCIQQDVCLQQLPVIFCLDRAGLTLDGPTHHGLWDLTYLRCLPNAVVMQPKDAIELQDMLHAALKFEKPVFIRYPRGASKGNFDEGLVVKNVTLGAAETVKEGKDIILWVLGDRVYDFLPRLESMEKLLGCTIGLVNARFAKPLDKSLLLQQSKHARLFVTIEDNVLAGGFGSAVIETLNDAQRSTPVLRIGWPDRFIPFASTVEDLQRPYGLLTDQIEATIVRAWNTMV